MTKSPQKFGGGGPGCYIKVGMVGPTSFALIMIVTPWLLASLCTLAVATPDGRARHLQTESRNNRLDGRADSGQYLPDTYAATETTAAPPPSTTLRSQRELRAMCLAPRGMFPHPDDCHKYLDCWDGRVLEKSCPNDLVFSDLSLSSSAPQGGFCDYLEYVDCGSRPLIPKINGGSPGGPFASPPTPTPVTPAPGVAVRWVNASNGVVPPGAQVTGSKIVNGILSNIFVGRVVASNTYSSLPHLLPCRLDEGKGCYVAWNNQEYLETNYQVMMAASAVWQTTNNATAIPAKAIIVGSLNFPVQEDMFLGRATLQGSTITGYLTKSRPNLVQTLNGATYFARNYEILVVSN